MKQQHSPTIEDKGLEAETCRKFPMQLPSSMLSSLVTLFITIGPIETAVIFAGLTTGIHQKERRSLAPSFRCHRPADAAAFAMGGNFVPFLLHISLPAFRVAG